MINKLKTFAIAILATGATVAVTQAQTPPYAVHNVSVNWTLYLPDTSVTNSKGEIKDTYKTESYNTASLLADLGSALGKSFKGESLVLISELSPGSNLTVGSNVVVQTYDYTNSLTNSTYTNTLTVLTLTNVPPLTNFDGLTNWVVTATNPLATNFVYEVTNSVIVETNATYYIKSGKTLTPLTNTFFFGFGLADLLSSSVTTSDTNTVFANRAQDYTNSIFKGTITTNLAITGSLYDQGSFDVNAIGTGNVSGAAGADLGFSGAGFANAVTTKVGSGKTALPWSTWNVTWTGIGSGVVGGTYTPDYTNVIPGTNFPTTAVTNVYYANTNGTNVKLSGSVTDRKSVV